MVLHVAGTCSQVITSHPRHHLLHVTISCTFSRIGIGRSDECERAGEFQKLIRDINDAIRAKTAYVSGLPAKKLNIHFTNCTKFTIFRYLLTYRWLYSSVNT
jgi:hypothetical protein